MPPIDRVIKRPTPLEAAACLLVKPRITHADKCNAANAIRDLIDLTRAQRDLLACYRIGSLPSERVLNTIKRLSSMIP